MGKRSRAAAVQRPDRRNDLPYLLPQGLSSLLRVKEQLAEFAQQADAAGQSLVQQQAVINAMPLIEEAIRLHTETVQPIGRPSDWPVGEGGMREPTLNESAKNIDRMAYVLVQIVNYLTDQRIRMTDRTYLQGVGAKSSRRKGAEVANEAHAELRDQYQPAINACVANGMSYEKAKAAVAKQMGVSATTVKRHTKNPSPKNRSRHR